MVSAGRRGRPPDNIAAAIGPEHGASRDAGRNAPQNRSKFNKDQKAVDIGGERPDKSRATAPFDPALRSWLAGKMKPGEANVRECGRRAPAIIALSMVAIGIRHRLHGDDRQPAIWLDAFCPA